MMHAMQSFLPILHGIAEKMSPFLCESGKIRIFGDPVTPGGTKAVSRTGSLIYLVSRPPKNLKFLFFKEPPGIFLTHTIQAQTRC